jgi:hypothetical protein
MKVTGLPAWKRAQPGQVGNQAALSVATSAGGKARHLCGPNGPPAQPSAYLPLDKAVTMTSRSARTKANSSAVNSIPLACA